MAGVRGQFQFSTEHAEKLLQGRKRREMGAAFQAGNLRLFHAGKFRELGLTEPASFPQLGQFHGNPHFLLRLWKSLANFGSFLICSFLYCLCVFIGTPSRDFLVSLLCEGDVSFSQILPFLPDRVQDDEPLPHE